AEPGAARRRRASALGARARPGARVRGQDPVASAAARVRGAARAVPGGHHRRAVPDVGRAAVRRAGPPPPTPAARPRLVPEVAAAGLPDEFAAAADDESWDAALSDSLDAASKACGPHPLSPTLVLDESLTGLSGPVFCPAPAGEAALRAWDAVRVLLAEPGFF